MIQRRWKSSVVMVMGAMAVLGVAMAGTRALASSSAQITVSGVEPMGQNIAVGKPVSTDSADGANPAANANDGDAASSWYALDNKPGHVWSVDLQSQHLLTGIGVEFGLSSASQSPYFLYKIQVSRDGATWRTVVTQGNASNRASLQYWRFSTGEERYVRIVFIGQSRGVAAQLAEFDVYSQASPLAIRGADVSMLQELENHGAVFKLRGKPMNALQILKKGGVNYVRLRVWVNPAGGMNNLQQLLSMARQAKRFGLPLLLDLHYSDTWADPGHQTIPAAWKHDAFLKLEQDVKSYSANVTRALANQGTPPSMVQIGNEVTNGILWPVGEVNGSYDSPKQWRRLAALLDAGIAGVHEGAGDHHVSIMIHVDDAGGNGAARYFFDHVIHAGLSNFDVIGLSYYPFWDGSLSTLGANLDDLAHRYHKPLVVAETAFPWTLTNDDNYPEQVSSADSLPWNYPASPLGQERFLQDLMAIIRSVPHHLGLGLFYWEPEWIPVKGAGWEPGAGDSWGNMTLFDNHGNALPSIWTFSRYAH